MKEEVKELTIVEPTDLDKPRKDTRFAQESAKFLVDIIKKNNWAKKLGDSSEHIQYEGWQTAGKYYGLSVKTHDAEYVELGGTWGFKAKASVVNEVTGVEVGSAEAYCMSDEYNWKNKPKFQLASMAQTRAGSKALRQILGFVVALAGYNPTPVEEMVEVGKVVELPKKPLSSPITVSQKGQIMVLLGKKGKTMDDLSYAIKEAFKKELIKDLTFQEADGLIIRLERLPDKNGAVGKLESVDIDLDEVEKEIEQQRLE